VKAQLQVEISRLEGLSRNKDGQDIVISSDLEQRIRQKAVEVALNEVITELEYSDPEVQGIWGGGSFSAI
jgi:hypothetical protein